MNTMSAPSRRLWIAAALCSSLLGTAARAAPAIGQPAPAFELQDTAGKLVKLSDFKGRAVVLEWTNPGCPFVQKHYGTQNMQALQKEFRAKNVAWLTISSTAAGTADHLAPPALAAKYQAWGANPTAVLMDDAGRVGQAYGAKTTPHIYVIDTGGRLAYAGGIDDKRSANPADVPAAKNHVKAALDELLAGKPVSTPTAAPYGCSIKYAPA